MNIYNRKRAFFVLMLFINQLHFAQVMTLKPIVKVTYDAKLQMGERFQQNQKFVVIGNSSEYYFAAQQNFLDDTKAYKPSGIDLQAISDYFQERLFKTGPNCQVIFSYIDAKIRYSERQAVQWVLYGNTKVIGGVQCQMATTNLFGRRWIAYFAKDGYDYSIGPYKFSGLPGLIFEIYDTRGHYHFTLTKVEKYNQEMRFNLNNYKLFSKENYLKAKYNLEFEGAGYPPMFGELKKEYDETAAVLKRMYNNPMEVKP